ncbi:urease accessory protein UreE [Martelella alba]|uniref:Urease accessory protein UreE n=1 Tax=Martelella alba TaxID=2590451 RepID=A0ABY2SM03_9HYPH|nr:urease accessory protein UreE [Martelella alba]TKI06686.1 urease accessory protein UreE [Martelella alba]
MIVLTKRLDHAHDNTATLTIDLDTRLKSRAKVILDDGREAGLMLPRGHILRGGELLSTDDGGEVVLVVAAVETVSTVYASAPLLLARICYHLGNRHVPLQIDQGWVRYQHDHVLDEMVRGLGATVAVEQAPFEPESGAYQSAPHSHGHHH